MIDVGLFYELVLILVTALIFGFLAGKLKQPPVIGYLIGGIFVGLFSQGITKATAALTDIGVILLMFTLGIEFSFRRMVRVKEVVVFGAFGQVFFFSAILAFVTKHFLNLDWFSAVFLGMAFSLSSTAIAVKILSDRGEVDTLYGEILTGWLLVQDLLVIPIWILIPNLAQVFSGNTNFSFLNLLWLTLVSLFKAGVILYLVYLLGKKTVPLYLNRIARTNSRELFLIAVVLLISFLGLLVSFAGLSPALGAFLAGLLISETTQSQAIFAEIRPLRDIFSIIFFVSLGLLFNVFFVFQNFTQIFFITTVVIVLKFLLVTLIMKKFHCHTKTIFLTSLGLLSVGEFAFVLGRYGLEKGYINATVYSMLLGVTVLSMLTSPFFMNLGDKLYDPVKKLLQKISPRIYDYFFIKTDRQVSFDDGLSLEGHVVICGHGRVGKHITKILLSAGIPFVVVDYNQKVVSDLQKHGHRVVYGDPSDLEVLDYAQVDKARVVVIAVPDRHSQEMIVTNSLNLNKNIVIICRSHFDEDINRLYALGVHAIVQPEFEAALHMSGVLLKLYKVSREQISSLLNTSRKDV